MPANKEMTTAVSFAPMRRVSNVEVPSATTLIAMATEPGTVRDLALYVAALPCHRDTRKSADFPDSKILRPQPKDKWLPRFRANLWAHYKWVVHVCHPSGREVANAKFHHKTTKRKRPERAGSGLVTRKQVPSPGEAHRARAATREECRPHPCVLWLDNYNKQRFSKNPGVVPSKANRWTAEVGDTKA